MAFELPSLLYDYNELEPHIDARTMEIHHSKHHNGYTTNLNNAIADTPLADLSIEEILNGLDLNNNALRNNGGGFYNHSLFWEIMSPNGGGLPVGILFDAIENKFGSFENFKTKFSNAAATQFGSGWAWLIFDNGELKISSTPNQDNPLMSKEGKVIIGMDVWEHAYYLKHKSQRGDYIDDFFEVLDWNKAEENYQNIING